MATYTIFPRNVGAPVHCFGATVTNYGPSTAFYSSLPTVTPTSFQGSLASGASAALEGTQFFVVATDRAILNAPEAAVGTGTGPAGPQGPIGPQGAAGAQGPQGIQGATGGTGAAGANGTGFVWKGNWNAGTAYSIGDVVAFTNGGFTSFIAVTTSTGVSPTDASAQWDGITIAGPAGPTGPQGVPGPQGATGATGATGTQGLQGAQGIQGPQGATGLTGPPGTGSGAGIEPIIYSRDTAAVAASGKWVSPGPGSLDQASLSTVGAPVGSALSCQVLLNGSAVGTLTIGAGSTVTVRQSLGSVALVAGDTVSINCTSVGSGTAATNVVLVVWAVISTLSSPVKPTFDSVATGLSNIVSYWKLGEPSGTTVADSSGSNPGTYNGTPTLNQAGIVANPTTDKAALFDGVNQHVAITGTSSLQSTTPTVWAWVSLPTTPGSEVTLLTIADTCVGIRVTASRTVRAYVWNGTANVFASGILAIPTSTSTLISISYGSGTLSLYINGVLDVAASSTAITYTPSVYTSTLAAAPGPTNAMNVKMEKVGYVNRALSANEHLALYTAGT